MLDEPAAIRTTGAAPEGTIEPGGVVAGAFIAGDEAAAAPAPLLGRWRDEIDAGAGRGTTRFRPARIRAAMAQAGLVLVMLTLAAVVLHYEGFDRLIAGITAGTMGLAEATAWDDVSAALNAAYLGAVVVCAVLWLTWQYRAVRNLDALVVESPPVSPRASVFWWFAPFANLVMVPRIVRDLLDRSAGRSQATAASWALVLAWWGTFLVGNYIVFLYRAPADPTLEDLRGAATASIIAAGFRIVAAVLAVALVAQVRRRQARRNAELSTIQSAAASAAASAGAA